MSRFGDLRSLMQHAPTGRGWWRTHIAPDHDVPEHAWMGQVRSLLKQAHTDHSDEYQDVWVPYLEGFKDVWRACPLIVSGLDALPIWRERAPFASLGVCPRHTRRGRNLGQTLAQDERIDGVAFLDLSEILLYKQGASALGRSPHTGALRTLVLDYCAVTDLGVSSILSSPTLGELRELYMSSGLITDTGMGVLARGALPELEVLALERNRLTGAAAGAIAESPYAARLTSLSLNHNALGAVGARHLADGDWPRLRSLDLRAAELGDKGVAWLTTGTGFGALSHLNLTDNRLTDASARTLAGAPMLGNVTRLEILGDNEIGPGGVRALRESPHVRDEVRETFLT